MLYNSFIFIYIFLPVTLFLYYSVGFFCKKNVAISVLVLCSLVFYGYWNWCYLFLIVASMISNFFIGAMIIRFKKAWIMFFGVIFNLGVLGYYKYIDFFIGSLGSIWGAEYEALGIILPLGVSFFTFQQIAFLVDAYKGKVSDINFGRYCLFVSFFPQLIAGPIVHHKEMMPQFLHPAAQKFNVDNFSIGLILFSIGLAKKVVIADQIAPWANGVFDCSGQVGMLEAWVGVLSYTLQLYFDFSGYSDMAIGLGKFFNISIPQNFNSPYKAVNIIDFWRRWHITLGRFLRDYLYIPLGGNRVGRFRVGANVMVTMLLGGLWHGANWTFVVWGGFHGVLMIVVTVWKRFGYSMPVFVARFFTFSAVIFGWAFFRAESLDGAMKMVWSMIHPKMINFEMLPANLGGQIVILLLLLFWVNFMPNSMNLAVIGHVKKRYAVFSGALFFLCMLSMYDAKLNNIPTEFLYFNF